MEKGQLCELFDFGLGQILVEGYIPILQIGAEAKARLGDQRLSGAVLAR